MMSIGDIFKESEIPRAEIAGCHVQEKLWKLGLYDSFLI